MLVKNTAVIAHVDHGKTTLVDGLLKQGGAFHENATVAERVMDSNDLERERGITILAKCTSIHYQDKDNGQEYKINVIDTPGHADFGGEVERILNMADGVVLLVDSAEGPMPQTKFVLSKALKLGLCPIVVINKIDRTDARIKEVLSEIEDLFLNLGANDHQLDFPVIYAIGRNGVAGYTPDKLEDSLEPLFKTIVSKTPDPENKTDAPFSFLPSILDSDQYLGRLLIGKVYSGVVKINSPIKVMNTNGEIIETGKITKLFSFKGINKEAVTELYAGDIGCIAGLSKTTVGHTVCDPLVNSPIPTTPIDPPIISMCFGPNTSPLVGQEGKILTSRQIKDRIYKEAEKNTAIQIKDDTGSETIEVYGRGELQLSVLIENMRREGFELTISRPKVIMQKDENGQLLEPMEELFIDVDNEFVGIVIEKVSLRQGKMLNMEASESGKTKIHFLCPSRGLIGYRGELLNDTRGTAIANRLFHSYMPYCGEITSRINGVLISNSAGETVAYALANLEDRGILFVNPGVKVYEGMIIGEHSKSNDLEVNPMKGKQLTNVRSVSKDEAIRLTPPRQRNLEETLSYLEDDEVAEVTPKSIRLRKMYLTENERKRNKGK